MVVGGFEEVAVGDVAEGCAGVGYEGEGVGGVFAGLAGFGAVEEGDAGPPFRAEDYLIKSATRKSTAAAT